MTEHLHSAHSCGTLSLTFNPIHWIILCGLHQSLFSCWMFPIQYDLDSSCLMRTTRRGNVELRISYSNILMWALSTSLPLSLSLSLTDSLPSLQSAAQGPSSQSFLFKNLFILKISFTLQISLEGDKKVASKNSLYKFYVWNFNVLYCKFPDDLINCSQILWFCWYESILHKFLQ